MENLLPIGSVVELDHMPGYMFVILGYLQKVHEKVYDYMGALYPNGITGADSCIMFQEKEISHVVFEGYLDDEGQAFTSTVPKLIQGAAMAAENEKKKKKR